MSSDRYGPGFPRRWALPRAANSRGQIGARRETDTAVRRHGYPLARLTAADRPDLTLLDLSGFKGAEAGENDAIATGERFADAVEHCVKRSITLRARTTELPGNLGSQVSFS